MAETTQISFRISNDLLSALKWIAQEEDRSAANVLNRIVRHYLASHPSPQQETKAAQRARERVLREGAA